MEFTDAGECRQKKDDESMKVLEFYDVVRSLDIVARTEDALFSLATQRRSLEIAA